MWDQRYGEEGFAYGTEANDFLVEVVEQIPSGEVLCLAEGEGRNAVFLAERGYQVTAVDMSPVGLAKAKKLAADRGVEIDTVVANLAEYEPEPGRFSGLISIWAHLPPDVRGALHQHCVRGLAPGGVFVLEAYTPAQVGRGTGGPPIPELTMTEAGLREELDGLEFVRCNELVRHVAEGKYHNGESAVVQLVARAPAS